MTTDQQGAAEEKAAEPLPIPLYEQRTFLNPKRGMAAIEARVVHWDRGVTKDVSAVMRLSDCHDTIELDFDYYLHPGESREEAATKAAKLKEKVRRLKETVDEFSHALHIALSLATERDRSE